MINRNNDEIAAQSFLGGTDFASYRYLGFHVVPDDRGEKYAVFRVWAPNAKEVFLVGDFNGWEETYPMKRNDSGIYTATLLASEVKNNQNYKFKITTADGRTLFKADPYAVFSEAPPATASKIFLSAPYAWHDAGYLADRKKLYEKHGRDIPLNIYKLSLPGFKSNGVQKYSGISDDIIPYVKQMGYTHIELVTETDEMSEELLTSFFAPNSRYGTPDDFRSFIDALHCAGIGVIIDLSFTKIKKCEQGLTCFDGTKLYEHQNDDDDNNTPSFDMSKGAVTSFLLSNAVFFIEEFHIDGIITDLSQMLRENSDCAVFSFFKTLNSGIASRYPDVITAAKAPSRLSNVTVSVSDGGLGFSYVRDRHIEKDILLRSDLSFGSKLACAAKHGICALSDSGSFIGSMGGDNFERFSKSRLALACMMLSPVKKLTYMGTEIGQFSDKEHNTQVRWEITGDPMHKKHQLFSRDLGLFYLSHPILWQDGGTKENPGCCCDDVLSFVRINAKNTSYKELIAVINFGKKLISEFDIPVPQSGEYRKVFSSALSVYGGSEEAQKLPLTTFTNDTRKYYIKSSISPMSVSVFEHIDAEQ